MNIALTKQALATALLLILSPAYGAMETNHKPAIYQVHGESISDPYAWLDNDSPVRDTLIDTENTNTAHYLNKDLQTKLRAEILTRSALADNIDVWQDGAVFFKKDGTKIFYKQNHDWQLLIDTNTHRNTLNTAVYITGIIKASPNGKLFAISHDDTGNESYRIDILDKTGKIIDSINHSDGSVVWVDDEHIAYISDNLTQVKLHHVNTKSDDKVIYQERLHGFYLGLDKSSSGDFVLLTRGNLTASQAFFAKNSDVLLGKDFTAFANAEPNTEYYLDHYQDNFILKTNHTGTMSLYVLNKSALQNWQTHGTLPTPIFTAHDGDELETFSVTHDYVMAKVRHDGVHQIYYVNVHEPKAVHQVQFHDDNYMVWLKSSGFDKDGNTTKNLLRLGYTSPTTPKAVLYYDMDNHQFVGETVQADGYITKQLWVDGKDGTRLPVTLVYKKGYTPNHNNPLLVYGYGAYGFSLDPVYGSGYLSLVDRGFVYAFAHVRGGGEMGQAWHDDGKLQYKQHSFDDFIAITKALQNQGYGTPNTTFAMGESAGGLLVANACLTNPSLYQGCVLSVPLLDILKPFYQGKLTSSDTAEFDEWGDPNDKADYDHIKSYNPYDLIKPNDYPNMLIMTNRQDKRIDFADGLKFIAKLRANHTGEPRQHLIHVGTGGHAGTGNGRTDSNATAFAFILNSYQNHTKNRSP